MRLLISAFEPFGGETQNPSARVLARLRSAPPPGVRVTGLVLPVVRGRALALLKDAFGRGEAFDAWLGLGQAGGRERVSIERVALNVFRAEASRPASGARGLPFRRGERVHASAPAAYLCRWPARELVGALLEADFPVALSYSAGAYVCNEVLFGMEHWLRSASTDVRTPWAGFVHLPYLPEQLAGKPDGTPALPLELQLRSVAAALAWLRDALAAAAQQGEQQDTQDQATAHRQ